MDRNISPSDDIVVTVVCSSIKSHKDSIEEFRKAGREDLIEKLEREINYLSIYLPKQLPITELPNEINMLSIATNSKEDNLTLKYQIGSTEGTWKTYTGPVEMSANGKVYARPMDSFVDIVKSADGVDVPRFSLASEQEVSNLLTEEDLELIASMTTFIEKDPNLDKKM